MNHNKRIKHFVLLFIYLVSTGNIASSQQQSAEKLTVEMNYWLSLPEGYNMDSLKKWPLLIFLHGGGECGDDLEKVKVNGPPKLIEQGRKFPFITVSPLATIWFRWEPDMLLRLLAGLHQKLRIDPDRVYLTGLSLGGDATWKLALKQPRLFAAIAPVCAEGDTTELWKLRNVAVWAFHGAKDDVVPPSKGALMISTLKKYNPSAKFTLYPDANHNSWDSAYNGEALYTWLLKQKRKLPVAQPVTRELLKPYAGQYVVDKDTLSIRLTDDGLVMQMQGEDRYLGYLGNNQFFVIKMDQYHISFHAGKNGIEGFTLYGDQKTMYKRIWKK